jgi:hypothetical protein
MMIDAISIYDRLRHFFPEIGPFRIPLEETYHSNSTAGKQIDLANAIYECIGKNAWATTPTAPTESRIERAKITDILAGAKEFFEEHDPDFYEDIYTSLTTPAGRILGNRSASGDISHGHLPSKKELSPAHAAMSLNLALSFAAYYFNILEMSSGKMKYDDHSGKGQFNEWLNEKGDRIGGAYYSWLLYQHDYDAYESYFDEFQALIEE